MDSQDATAGQAQRILENLSTAVLLFDTGLHLTYINGAGEMLLAVSARQVLGQSIAELIHCPLEGVEQTLDRSLASDQPFTEREHCLSLHDGREIKVDCTVIPIAQADGENELLVEMQQVDRQLRITREESLRSRNEASRALVRGLAHEVKNPLGGLRGAAQLLERELPSEELREYTQIIVQEADRLRKLVDNMLGPNELPKQERVYIHQVLERVCQLVQAESGGRLRILRDYDPSIPPMLGDFDQLIQAILNILRNGARATGEQGVLGIKTRVLRQFTIGNRSGHSQGMGLGLSISQALIGRHQGLIEFRSRPGDTVFTVLLPLEQIDG